MTGVMKVCLVVVGFLHACCFVATAFAPTTRSPRFPTCSLAATCDVAVVGGGFGGLYTALAISRESRLRRLDLDVTLVDDSENFVFLPLLYDLTVGTASESEVCPKYEDLLQGTGVKHVKASFESFEGRDCQVLNLSEGDPLSTRASVIAVGATPQSILSSIPGASEFAQPFYTKDDARKTQLLLTSLEKEGAHIAVVGGGYGGVELAASVQRRLPDSQVTILSRGAPMAGTRAEPLVDKALQRFGVSVEDCSVQSIDMVEGDKFVVKRDNGVEMTYDAVLWTAGSAPAYPVSGGLDELMKSENGRLAIDSSLRCMWKDPLSRAGGAPVVWALGDCSEIVSLPDGQPVVPRTAQGAMQQAETVARNVLAQLSSPGSRVPVDIFQYQDLGSLLTLGGPNGAVLAPLKGPFAPVLAPVLDTAGEVLGVADDVFTAVGRLPLVEKMGLSPDNLGLSLGSHGLGVGVGGAPGTLAGTITGAARRAVYAARMPTNRQRAVSVVSAAISTAVSLAKEAQDRRNE